MSRRVIWYVSRSWTLKPRYDLYRCFFLQIICRPRSFFLGLIYPHRSSIIFNILLDLIFKTQHSEVKILAGTGPYISYLHPVRCPSVAKFEDECHTYLHLTIFRIEQGDILPGSTDVRTTSSASSASNSLTTSHHIISSGFECHPPSAGLIPRLFRMLFPK